MRAENYVPKALDALYVGRHDCDLLCRMLPQIYFLLRLLDDVRGSGEFAASCSRFRKWTSPEIPLNVGSQSQELGGKAISPERLYALLDHFSIITMPPTTKTTTTYVTYVTSKPHRG